MDEFDKALDQALERCRQDAQLSAIEELRKCSPSKRWQAFLDDIHRRNTDLRERFANAYGQHVRIQATPETGKAIASYHQSVATPLLGALLNELTGIHAELAIRRMEHKSYEDESIG